MAGDAYADDATGLYSGESVTMPVGLKTAGAGFGENVGLAMSDSVDT